MSADDPLGAFKVWEGEALGENRVDARPGLDHGPPRIAPKDLLHIAGAWAMSSARRDRAGILHPVAYVRIVARVRGSEAYHVLDGIIDADVADEWATVLRECAAAARRDVRAAQKPSPDPGVV